MIVLENMHLIALTSNPEVVKNFPVIANLKTNLPKTQGGCNCQGSRKGPDFNAIKRSLAMMSQQDKDKFKTMTGFASVKVIYSNGSSTETTIL